jgi:hypothetical protein
MMGWRRRFLRAAVCAPGLGLAAMVSPLLACAADGRPALHASLLRMTEHGDLILGDNGRARLAGIRMMRAEPGQPDPLGSRFDELVRPWRDQGTVLVNADQRPDRWGRQLASVISTTGKPDAHLGLSLVRNGFALAWAAELPPNCRNIYLQAEQDARRSGLGRWTQMQHKALDAANGAEVAFRAGHVAVMSGRVNHVGQTRRATYLNFGARGAGASAELGLSTWRQLEGQGWTRDGLKGKIVRVRGVVMEGRPARLLLGDASAIEFLN